MFFIFRAGDIKVRNMQLGRIWTKKRSRIKNCITFFTVREHGES